jgi:hypothetical protein
MTRYRRAISRCLVAAATMTVVGCTGRSSEQLVPVMGKITFNGAPLPAGKVIFHPDAGKGNTSQQEPRGTIGADGTYYLKTGNRRGASRGWYKVTVFALKPVGPQEGMKPPEWLAPERYSDPARSELNVEIVDNAPARAYDFDLKP